MSTAEIIGVVLGVGGALTSALVAAFRVGELARGFRDLSQRHADFAKETREGRGVDGGRISALELFREGTAVKIDAIRDDLAAIKTTIDERLPRPRAVKR